MADVRFDDDVPSTFNAREIDRFALLEHTEMTGELDPLCKLAKYRHGVPLEIIALVGDTGKFEQLES